MAWMGSHQLWSSLILQTIREVGQSASVPRRYWAPRARGCTPLTKDRHQCLSNMFKTIFWRLNFHLSKIHVCDKGFIQRTIAYEFECTYPQNWVLQYMYLHPINLIPLNIKETTIFRLSLPLSSLIVVAKVDLLFSGVSFLLSYFSAYRLPPRCINTVS